MAVFNSSVPSLQVVKDKDGKSINQTNHTILNKGVSFRRIKNLPGWVYICS